MKWQFVVLVIGASLGYVTAGSSETSPHPVPSVFSSGSIPCETWNPKCVGESKRCTGDWWTTDCQEKDSVCCNFPLHCVAGVCAMDNNNANCSSLYDCVVDHYGTGLHACIKGKCVMQRNVMDSCKDDTQCAGDMKCVNGKCEGLPENATCVPSGPRAFWGTTRYVCAAGLMCSPTKLKCVPAAKAGEKCGEVPCGAGMACNRAMCIAMYSLDAGADCDNDAACSEKTTCNEGKCVNGESFKLVRCLHDSDCGAGTNHMCELCSHVKGQRYCGGSTRGIDCRTEWKKAQTCYANKHCPPVPSAYPDTCSQAQCSSETDAILKCRSNCWSVRQQFGRCTASQLLKHCPAFPQWAYIVIGFGGAIGVILMVVVVALIVRKVRTKKAGYVPIQST